MVSARLKAPFSKWQKRHRKTTWLRPSPSLVETELNVVHGHLVQLHHITEEMDLHLSPSQRTWELAVIPWLLGTHLQEPLPSIELFQVSPVEHGGVLVGPLWKHLLHVCCSPESLVMHQKGHPIIAAKTGPVIGGGEKCPFPLQPLLGLHIKVLVKVSSSPTNPLHPQEHLKRTQRKTSLRCWQSLLQPHSCLIHLSLSPLHYPLKNSQLRWLRQEHPP